MLTPKFIKPVLAACESAMERHGFRRPRRHTVVFEVSKDFLGWVGLNHGSYPTHVRITPSIGIHCVPLMRLIDELSGQKYELGRYATFAVPLGDLDPGAHAFEFTGEESLAPESERLALTLRQTGIPHMRLHASYTALLPILEKRVPLLGGYPQRFAAALYLMGRGEEARQFVLDRRAEYQEDEEIVRQRFDAFAIPFLKLLAT